MNFDPTSLLLSTVASGIGLVLLVYGKKQSRWPHMVGGLLFMVYPYFVESVFGMLAWGVALGLGLWWVVQAGY
jgi:hypothetical protein